MKTANNPGILACYLLAKEKNRVFLFNFQSIIGCLQLDLESFEGQ